MKKMTIKEEDELFDIIRKWSDERNFECHHIISFMFKMIVTSYAQAGIEDAKFNLDIEKMKENFRLIKKYYGND